MRAFISRCRALGRDMSLEFLDGYHVNNTTHPRDLALTPSDLQYLSPQRSKCLLPVGCIHGNTECTYYMLLHQFTCTCMRLLQVCTMHAL